jgi:DNA-binding LytR/AlgR family response regulator
VILSSIIIDDEPDAHKLLELYCKKTGYIKVIQNCFSAKDGLDILTQHNIDFIFLDINMPEISGIEMLNISNENPKVIFTTAHNNFALEGYEYNTVDYLLKPIRFDRFLKAVEKIKNQKYPSKVNLPQAVNLNLPKKTIVYPNEIIYIEALGNYVKVYSVKENKPIVLHITMISMENLLVPYGFIRCHKKFLINRLFVDSIKENLCRLYNEINIPVGISYQQKVKSIFKEL